MATCPFCHQEALRIITAITAAEVIKSILRHLKRHLRLAADSPPIAPARSRQGTFDWVASALPLSLASGRRAGNGGMSVERTTPLSVSNPSPPALQSPQAAFPEAFLLSHPWC